MADLEIYAAAIRSACESRMKGYETPIYAADVIRVLDLYAAKIAVMGEALEQVQNTTHPSTGYSDLSARRSAFKVASEARLAATKEPS